MSQFEKDRIFLAVTYPVIFGLSIFTYLWFTSDRDYSAKGLPCSSGDIVTEYQCEVNRILRDAELK